MWNKPKELTNYPGDGFEITLQKRVARVQSPRLIPGKARNPSKPSWSTAGTGKPSTGAPSAWESMVITRLSGSATGKIRNNEIINTYK